MMFENSVWRWLGESNGRAKAGPYLIIRPAEAGAGVLGLKPEWMYGPAWSRPLLSP
jgi:hypothetical protein